MDSAGNIAYVAPAWAVGSGLLRNLSVRGRSGACVDGLPLAPATHRLRTGVVGATMGFPLDLAGKTFGRLTAVRQNGRNGKRQAMWTCLCSCGTVRRIAASSLINGNSQSCGCQRTESARARLRTHGQAGSARTAEYGVWSTMKGRCHNPLHSGYSAYGARGVAVCVAWRESFESFIADMGPRPSVGHSIDRINNDGDYEPGNCRWATRKEQSRNKRSTRFIEVDGVRRCVSEWAEVNGIKATLIYQRLFLGWSEKDAVTRRTA